AAGSEPDDRRHWRHWRDRQSHVRQRGSRQEPARHRQAGLSHVGLPAKPVVLGLAGAGHGTADPGGVRRWRVSAVDRRGSGRGRHPH
nr:hypothetical protein [Tanacetum cinerariifolium]